MHRQKAFNQIKSSYKLYYIMRRDSWQAKGTVAKHAHENIPPLGLLATSGVGCSESRNARLAVSPKNVLEMFNFS